MNYCSPGSDRCHFLSKFIGIHKPYCPDIEKCIRIYDVLSTTLFAIPTFGGNPTINGCSFNT